MPFFNSDIPQFPKLVCPECNGTGKETLIAEDTPCYLCSGAGSTKLDYTNVCEAEIIALIGCVTDSNSQNVNLFIIQLILNMLDERYKSGFSDGVNHAEIIHEASK